VESILCPVRGCYAEDGQPRELRDTPICAPCHRRACTALDGMRDLYVALRVEPKGATTEEFVTGSSALPVPIVVHLHVLASAIANTLVNYERVCRVLCSLSPAPWPVREGYACGYALGTLRTHGEVLWAHPLWAPELANDLLSLRARGWSALRWGSTRIGLDLPCPACDLRTLSRYHGSDDFVCCDNCAARWDHAAYERLVAIMVADVASGS
jgi:hypothetical protein